ncbi:hypothetical protein ONZ45_g2389 [Pleurotus djamor]|nr:hypothetical protein ONZ45_g2389 [Pleurotus djamor]
MAVTDISLESLKKLTVPQLKALCKERHISGYSKLSKTSLVQKILESNCSGQGTTSAPESVNTQRTCIQSDAARPQPSPSDAVPSLTTDSPPSDCAQESGQAPNHTNIPDIISLKRNATAAEMTLSAPSCPPVSPSASPNPRPPIAINEDEPRARTSSKRPTTASVSLDYSSNAKRPKNTHIASEPATATATTPGSLHSKVDMMLDTTSHYQGKLGDVKAASATMSSTHTLLPILPAPPRPPIKSYPNPNFKGSLPKPTHGKRFKALTVRRPNVPTTTEDKPRNDLSIGPRAIPFPLTLHPITLPPKKSNRKHVVLYALICSYLDPASLRQCSLTARALRYAAYLSASYTLKREYSGTRLDALTKRHSPLTSNMWPYLRARQAERAQRIAEFDASFLGRCIPRHSVGDLLWSSPNDTEQIKIICRFLMTRLWFTLSLGGTQNTLDWSVVDAKEVVPAEIWSITLRYRCSRTEKLLVLAPTCEVIGSSGSDAGAAARVDWNAYITTQRPIGTDCKLGLLDHLSWPNHEEYDKGISKAWLTRIKNEGELGNLKRLVAERYLFASLMANRHVSLLSPSSLLDFTERSISGKYMTSLEMDQELSGRPSIGYCTSRPSRKSDVVNLYLAT